MRTFSCTSAPKTGGGWPLLQYERDRHFLARGVYVSFVELYLQSYFLNGRLLWGVQVAKMLEDQEKGGDGEEQGTSSHAGAADAAQASVGDQVCQRGNESTWLQNGGMHHAQERS